mmetsp:Transcript_13991/g.21343  ORF Transcript_13991/g.21343 Transcript_13991/m.21343 type:complete len:105 (+) Transcript_13991:1342-1656(+)
MPSLSRDSFYSLLHHRCFISVPSIIYSAATQSFLVGSMMSYPPVQPGGSITVSPATQRLAFPSEPVKKKTPSKTWKASVVAALLVTGKDPGVQVQHPTLVGPIS